MAVAQLKYFKNKTNNLVRAGDHSLAGNGVIMLPKDKAEEPSFANSVGVLVDEITKDQYDAIIGQRKQTNNVLRRRDKFEVVTVVEEREVGSKKGWKEIKQEVILDPHPQELREYQKAKEEGLLEPGSRVQLDVSQYAGADWGTTSQPQHIKE